MAASTITRSTWTDGVAGTILSDSTKNTTIYDPIDQMFGGSGSYATFTFGGLVAAEGFGTHLFQAGGTGDNVLRIRNTSAGTTNTARLEVGNDANGGLARLVSHSSTFTTSGPHTASGVSLRALGSGGLSVTAEDASGLIAFYTGGVSTSRVTIASGGVISLRDGVRLTSIISPSQLTANTNNWNPTNLDEASIIRVSTDASRNLTGITAQGTGTIILLCNVGSNNLVLVHNSTSTAANQFLCPGSVNLTLNANDSCWILYDGTSSRWRVIQI